MQIDQIAVPKVHILMSTYNGEAYLQTQLDSLFSQEDVTVQLTVRDDASTDATVSILQQNMKKRSVTVIEGENCGAARSFMKLIQAVPTENSYYAFCDQDDKWLPEKLKHAIQMLSEYPDTQPLLYYSDVRRVGADLEETEDPFHKNYHTEKFGAAMVQTAAPGCTMVFNHTLLKLLKSYEPEYLSMHDSWVLRVCAAVGGTVYFDPDAWILYRQHSHNVVGGEKKMTYSPIQLFAYRVRKFFDFSEKTGRIAEELKQGYEDQLTNEANEILELILACKKSFLARIKLFAAGNVKTGYLIQDMKFDTKVLLNHMWD